MIDAETRPAPGTQTIDRAVLLLRLVATFSAQGARLTDLAGESGLPAPTVRRILKRLAEHGLIAQAADGHRYSLGPLAQELALSGGRARAAAERHRPLMQRLVAETGATLYLLAQSGLDSLCIARLDPARPRRPATLEVGARLPLGAGVGGMVLLAELPAGEIARVVAANAALYARFMRTTGTSFHDHLRAAQRDGFVIRRSPVTPGLVGFGVPLRLGPGPADLALAGALDHADFPPGARLPLIARVQAMVAEHVARLAATPDRPGAAGAPDRTGISEGNGG
jgi:DNA-binding IclR family transcriptional regulator